MEQIRVTFPNGANSNHLPKTGKQNRDIFLKGTNSSHQFTKKHSSRLPKWKRNLSHLLRRTSSGQFSKRKKFEPLSKKEQNLGQLPRGKQQQQPSQRKIRGNRTSALPNLLIHFSCSSVEPLQNVTRATFWAVSGLNVHSL